MSSIIGRMAAAWDAHWRERLASRRKQRRLRLLIERLEDRTLLTTGTFNLNEPVSDGISVPGETDQWHFEAAAGQRVYLDVQQVGDPAPYLDFTLTAPDGGVVFTSSNIFGDP